MVILTRTMNHLSHVNINASIFDLCVNDCPKIFNLSTYTMFFKNIIEKKNETIKKKIKRFYLQYIVNMF